MTWLRFCARLPSINCSFRGEQGVGKSPLLDANGRNGEKKRISLVDEAYLLACVCMWGEGGGLCVHAGDFLDAEK